MSITEHDRKLDFRSRVPLPYGAHQSKDVIVNGAIIMAEMVDRFNSSRGLETKGPLLNVLNIIRDNEITEVQKRHQIAETLGII